MRNRLARKTALVLTRLAVCAVLLCGGGDIARGQTARGQAEGDAYLGGPAGSRYFSEWDDPAGDIQDVPELPEARGGELAGEMPAYVYSPAYYDTYGVGARALADYAPPGYEPRGFQEVPGVPEFSPITPPPIPVAGESGYLGRGMMPGSFLVPGTTTSLRPGGFVRLVGLFDFDPIGSRDDFVTNTIPVPQEIGQNQNFSARYSRLRLETWTPTEHLDWNVHTFIEGDFFNGSAQAAAAGGNAFRLRFAFADFGYFRIGQQNSVFMDSNAWPSVADFAGPRGLVNLRRPGVRVTLPVTAGFYWASGIEQPFSDITTNDLGVPVQDVPDFASHLRWEGIYGHAQLSGLLRSIAYRPWDEAVERLPGWGVSGSLVWHPWAALWGMNPLEAEGPCGMVRSRFLGQYTVGRGVARYIQDTRNQGLDAQVNPLTGEFDTLYTVGWTASYEQWFNQRWLANVTYSADFADSLPQQAAGTYHGANYLAVSLWWLPSRKMSTAVEYLTGERENIDGQSGRADRIQLLFQYNF